MYRFRRPPARALAGLLVVTALLMGPLPRGPAPTRAAQAPAPQHGVAFVQMPTARFGSPASLDSLAQAARYGRELGVDYRPVPQPARRITRSTARRTTRWTRNWCRWYPAPRTRWACG